jgi:hypothetical protein
MGPCRRSESAPDSQKSSMNYSRISWAESLPTSESKFSHRRIVSKGTRLSGKNTRTCSRISLLRLRNLSLSRLARHAGVEVIKMPIQRL